MPAAGLDGPRRSPNVRASRAPRLECPARPPSWRPAPSQQDGGSRGPAGPRGPAAGAGVATAVAAGRAQRHGQDDAGHALQDCMGLRPTSRPSHAPHADAALRAWRWRKRCARLVRQDSPRGVESLANESARASECLRAVVAWAREAGRNGYAHGGRVFKLRSVGALFRPTPMAPSIPCAPVAALAWMHAWMSSFVCSFTRSSVHSFVRSSVTTLSCFRPSSCSSSLPFMISSLRNRMLNISRELFHHPYALLLLSQNG